jgi:hypothetical protein
MFSKYIFEENLKVVIFSRERVWQTHGNVFFLSLVFMFFILFFVKCNLNFQLNFIFLKGLFCN